MNDGLKTNGSLTSIDLTRFETRVFIAISIAVLSIFAVAMLGSGVATTAQETTSCQVTDLGTLGTGDDSTLKADGRWTTEDCDSSFHLDSDAHNYQFTIDDGGRIRIELKSEDADPYLYLLDSDGNRITDNDDGGGRLDARIERDLIPGVYSIEATTVGGRRQGAADFSLTISRVQGCEPQHLGALELGTDLTATGTWTLDTCGSQFVVQHPAFGYSFEMATGGRVRIDLRSAEGDAVLSLISATAGLISANDDGGERRNSRIERYLQPGTYFVEATTYWEREAQLASADFELAIHLVDEDERQESGYQLKIETSVVPDHAVAGEPYQVHYRIGNVGNGPMTEDDGSVDVYAIGPRDWDHAELTIDSETGWLPGVSYHSGDIAASNTSVESDQVGAFELTINQSGTSWVWLVVTVNDESGEEIAFHSQWRELLILSGRTFEATTVSVDGVDYEVSSETDEEGEVTVLVSAADDAEAEIEPSTRAKAIYTAGVEAELLHGLFDRPKIAELPEPEERATISVFDPSSQTLLMHFAEEYSEAVTSAGLLESIDNGEVVNPATVEDLLISNAEKASEQFATLAASWRNVQEGVDDGEALWFTQALTIHSQLSYAERVLSPIVKAGEIVDAARTAENGWDDEDVQSMAEEIAGDASCGAGASELSAALRSAGLEATDELVDLDAELRVALPAYASAIDAVLCSASAADSENADFIATWSPSDAEELSALLESATELPASPRRLRIIARISDDGRIEHAVEFDGGEQVMPDVRYLSANASVGIWHTSSVVELDEEPIGKIRTRRLNDGRLEVGFVNTGGQVTLPEIRYFPAEMPQGVWLRSGMIEVPSETTLE